MEFHFPFQALWASSFHTLTSGCPSLFSAYSTGHRYPHSNGPFLCDCRDEQFDDLMIPLCFNFRYTSGCCLSLLQPLDESWVTSYGKFGDCLVWLVSFFFYIRKISLSLGSCSGCRCSCFLKIKLWTIGSRGWLGLFPLARGCKGVFIKKGLSNYYILVIFQLLMNHIA